MLKRMCPVVQKWIFCMVVVILTFSMMYVFMNDAMFVSDEGEIFVKGQAIAQGEILYSEVGSQHMPLMYYIAAIFSVMGANAGGIFRIYFYMLFALLWGLIALCYSDRFGKKTLLAVPVLYLAVLPTISMATTVLSEQLQAIGYVILAFELLQFRPDKPLTVRSCLMISLAVFVSFGSAFVSMFAIFAVFVTVLAQAIKDCVEQKRGFFKGIGHLFARYWLLIVIVLVPFVLMLGYFAAVGALGDLYGWTYRINRDIYPKYLGGYGSSVIASLFGGVQYILMPIQNLSFTYGSILQVLLLALAVFGVLYIQKRRNNKLLTIGCAFFLVAAATRDCFGFHGIPAIALMAVYASLVLSRLYVYLRRQASGSLMKQGLAVMLVLVLMTPFLIKVSAKLDDMYSPHASNELTNHGQAVSLLTENGEKVGFSVLNYEMLLTSDTIPASVTGGSCPWLWEYAGGQAMEELTTNPPRVFLFDPELETWSHKIVDYAPDLTAFINENYTSMNDLGYNKLYVRNDYYQEALELLNSAA